MSIIVTRVETPNEGVLYDLTYDVVYPDGKKPYLHRLPIHGDIPETEAVIKGAAILLRDVVWAFSERAFSGLPLPDFLVKEFQLVTAEPKAAPRPHAAMCSSRFGTGRCNCDGEKVSL